MIIYAAVFSIMYFVYFILKHGAVEDFVPIIFTFAVLFRLILFSADISTSGDVYRYIWEGKVVLSGGNPFEYPPDSPKFNALRTDKFPKLVTYPQMTTIYPGAAQAIFALGYILSGESQIGLKLIYLIAEIITMLVIIALLKRFGKPGNLVILYAWLPLPVMEYFINSHLDAAGIALFMASLFLFVKNKWKWSAVLLALAVSVKLYALLAFPFLFKKLGIKKGAAYGLILALVFSLTMAPFAGAGKMLYSALTKYLSSWSFNGGIYTFFNQFIHNGYTTHTLVFILLIVSLLIIFVYFKKTIRSIYLAWAAYIVLAPTLYPWYLGWIAALHPLIGFYSISAFLFLINLSNITPLQTQWREFTWVLLVEYIPFFALFIFDLYLMRKNELKEKLLGRGV